MGNPIPCFISDSDQARLWDAADTAEAMRAKRVEDYADNLMDGCRRFGFAFCSSINDGNDIYDGDLLPKLMTEIANWTGRSDDAAERMRKLHNLLAGEFQKIAEREVEA